MMKKNEPFRFKQFDVLHQANAQKVSTDSVLLGAWADLEKSKKILDIGTGCGVLSLMAAQRNPHSEIVAIEIDESFAAEAGINFSNSPFVHRIFLLNEDVRNHSGGDFNHIICNPPYFSNSLQSEIDSRNKARHDLNLSFDSLAESVSLSLDLEGKVSLVVPVEKKESIIRSFGSFELHLSRICEVRHTAQSPTSISLLEFQIAKSCHIASSELIIKDELGFTEGYKGLLKNFLVIF